MSINKQTQHYSNNGLLHYFSAGIQYWLEILGMEQIDYLCKFNNCLLTDANAYYLIWNKSIEKFQMLAKMTQHTHSSKHLHLRLVNPGQFFPVLRCDSVQPFPELTLWTWVLPAGASAGFSAPGAKCAGKQGWHGGSRISPGSLPSTASRLKQTQTLLGCWKAHL